MKIERTKNAERNIVFGVMLKVYQIAVPFLMRTAMIYFMGVEYLGLSSLFASVLQVLNLAELGVSSAMVYSMYLPIVEDDEATICALLRLYRTYYRLIGLVIAAAGLLLTPFIPALIEGELPGGLNIYILYWMNLAVTVLSYWLFAYKNSLLQAHQRTDVSSKVMLGTNSLLYGLQLLVIVTVKDYYLYTMVNVAVQVLTNLATALVVTRMYPRYRPAGRLPREKVEEINRRIRDLFTSKVGSVVVNSADTIVISAFLGLSALAVYQNYYYILWAVIGVVGIVFAACTAGIGNSIIVETSEKNFRDLRILTFLTCWIAGFCAACLLCLYQPFMEIWVGEELMLTFPAVICFCIYYFVYEINQLLNTYKDAAGIWHEDRFRPLVTALANLTMNLIMVQFWGLYGVILSTVLSMLFVGMPWLLHNLFTVLFSRAQLRPYLERLLLYALTAVAGCAASYGICAQVPLEGWPLLIVRGVICCVVPNLLFLAVYGRTEEFRACLALANTITRGKIPALEKWCRK